MQQIYIYKIYLFRSKIVRELSQEQGEKLAMVLVSPNCPKFVIVNDNVINVASIRSIEREEKKEYKRIDGELVSVNVKKELGGTDLAIHNKYLALKGEHGQLLLK